LTKFRLAAAAATAALAFAGCGGASDNKTLSYSDFGKQADQICADSKAPIKAITSKLNGDPAHDSAVWDELVTKLNEVNGKFTALKPPSELKADFDKFNSLTSQQIDLAKKAQAAAKAGDKAAYQATVKSLQGSNLDQESNTVASKLGAAECAKS
jgi:hypothetical protein